jgi:hypothetical protein
MKTSSQEGPFLEPNSVPYYSETCLQRNRKFDIYIYKTCGSVVVVVEVIYIYIYVYIYIYIYITCGSVVGRFHCSFCLIYVCIYIYI